MKKKKRNTLDSVCSVDTMVNQDSGCNLKISTLPEKYLHLVATDLEDILYNIS